MSILVINCGSTSVKAAVVEPDSGTCSAAGRVERIGSGAAMAIGEGQQPIDATTHDEALAILLPTLLDAAGAPRIRAVGHRVVHGGARFSEPVLIDDEVLSVIEELGSLAPLHNPANLAGIRAGQRVVPDVPHVAVFDTAFHATMPKRAVHYGISREIREKHGVRRYGFHGTSHQFVVQRAAAHLNEDVRSLRVISCHLGGGCSVAAVEWGRSVETSMGMTPVEGLVMATRPGDLDAGAVLHWMREADLDASAMDAILNRESGLKGLTGTRDMRDIEERASAGDEDCRDAIEVFCHRVRKYIGAYAAVMGGVDLIVFTAGVGENSSLIRHRICQRLDFLGARLDEVKNRSLRLSASEPVADFSQDYSRVRLLAVKTDEQLAIARETKRLITSQGAMEGLRPIPIAVSARHIHLTQEAVEALFGEGHTLTPRNPLSQPGQFACEEVLTVVGPKRQLERVRILGPVRPKCQIEISRTDEYWLGIDAPVRRSGNVENTPGATLRGPHGELVLDYGVICAWRHIHMTPEDAEYYGVEHQDLVEVAVDTEGRDLVLEM